MSEGAEVPKQPEQSPANEGEKKPNQPLDPQKKGEISSVLFGALKEVAGKAHKAGHDSAAVIKAAEENTKNIKEKLSGEQTDTPPENK